MEYSHKYHKSTTGNKLTLNQNYPVEVSGLMYGYKIRSCSITRNMSSTRIKHLVNRNKSDRGFE